jgi:hypothetical protein
MPRRRVAALRRDRGLELPNRRNPRPADGIDWQADDLVWAFTEKLKSFTDCAPTISIAIVPIKDGWDRNSEPERPQYPPSLPRAY